MEEVRKASRAQGGVQRRIEMDLADLKDSKLTYISPDGLSHSKYYIHIQTVDCAGTSGNVTVATGPSKNYASMIATGTTLALGADVIVEDSGDLFAPFFGISLKGATLGTQGKLIITLVCKD